MHRQRVVGEGTTVQPAHQQQRNQQRETRNEPQRNGRHPGDDEDQRGADTVQRRRDKAVTPHRRHVAILGLRQMTQHQRHDDNGREQRSHQIGQREDRHPASEIGENMRQPDQPPAHQQGHRWKFHHLLDHPAERANGKADGEQQRDDGRRQHIEPNLSAAQVTEGARQGEHRITHV
ncbi:hypothetical protein SDC9_159732 [bioreactor metagenome]|uniref:Uncharacterized protein n=1 Tax=bioreactor metagenome TaxID=1076179 RepID=A0A645FJ03_9ZZZZ